MKPAISIIVPIYNVDQYLRKCLNSILSQTFKDIEVILVNDGSTDLSGEICNEYADKDSRVKVFHQQSRGVSSARNRGVKLATGHYIGFVDGDDYVTKDMYENLYEACITTKSSIAICKLAREIEGKITNDIGAFYIKELDHHKAMSELFKGILYRFSLCNKLFKSHCFEGITFPVGRIHEDLSTTYKLFAAASKVVYINQIGYIYVKQQNSILTTRYNENRLDAFLGWDEILSFMQQEYPKICSEVINCFIYTVIDHFYYILNQVEAKQEQRGYLSSVQSNVRKHYKDIRKGTTLPIHYKFMITTMNYSVYSFVIMNKIKSKLVLKNSLV